MHNKINKFEDFKYTYDNINTWINNVDNKISILLVFLVAVIGYAFSIVEKVCLKNIQLFILFVAVILLVCGCLLCILALKGRVKPKINYVSLLFFGSISKMDRKEYFDKISKINQKQLTSDIKNQIYINSCICNKKFKFYNLAVDCLIISICFIAFVWIVNVFFI